MRRNTFGQQPVYAAGVKQPSACGNCYAVHTCLAVAKHKPLKENKSGTDKLKSEKIS